MNNRTSSLLLISLMVSACTWQIATPVVPPTAWTEALPEADVVPVSSASSAPAALPAQPVLEERLLPTGILDIGSTAAPVTLLLFTEHHCQYCRDFQQSYYPRLLQDFILAGKLRLQIVIFPLEKYRFSQSGAAGLLCAAFQQRGVAMHDRLMQESQTDSETVLRLAGELGLEKTSFTRCLSDGATKQLLTVQQSFARSLTIALVPTFYLNGQRLVGLPEYPDLRGRIEQLLAEAVVR